MYPLHATRQSACLRGSVWPARHRIAYIDHNQLSYLGCKVIVEQRFCSVWIQCSLSQTHTMTEKPREPQSNNYIGYMPQTNLCQSLHLLLCLCRFYDLLAHLFPFGLFDGFVGLDTIFLLLLCCNLPKHPVGRGSQAWNGIRQSTVNCSDAYYNSILNRCFLLIYTLWKKPTSNYINLLATSVVVNTVYVCRQNRTL